MTPILDMDNTFELQAETTHFIYVKCIRFQFDNLMFQLNLQVIPEKATPIVALYSCLQQQTDQQSYSSIVATFELYFTILHLSYFEC